MGSAIAGGGMDKHYKRINITIGEDQYAKLGERGVNISGLIRDLVGDYLSSNVITLQVGDETRRLYDLVVSNTGATDSDIEVHLREALVKVLDEKIAAMQALKKQVERR
jgi:hypothetical protein